MTDIIVSRAMLERWKDSEYNPFEPDNQSKKYKEMEELLDEAWRPVSDGMPLDLWLETKKAGEEGINICLAMLRILGGELEWVEKETGVTTVTHHSFAPPTHWRFIKTDEDDEISF